MEMHHRRFARHQGQTRQNTYRIRQPTFPAKGFLRPFPVGGLASTLSNIIKNRLGVSKIRGIEFSLMQRCAAHFAPKTYIDEAYMAGHRR
jgi:hypothetical protein